MSWQAASLDQLLPDDHRARVVWSFVAAMNLNRLYERIRAVEGGPGRDPIDPRILMALWMLATIEGISSARQLGRLCERDVAYMWICGGVGVNYHRLADFRSDHADVLDELLTDTIATLMHQGLVTLETIAQDGMRVRARAGSDSFRSRKTLEKCRAEAAEQVQRLKEESDAESPGDPDASNRRRRAARERAARERQECVEKALSELEQLEAARSQLKPSVQKKRKAPRASTTDPDARVMKMPDGGFRPAANVQYATDADTRMIVGVSISNVGSDRGEVPPMCDQLKQRYGRVPSTVIVDGGFLTKDDIRTLTADGIETIAPVHGRERMESRGNDPFARQRTDNDATVAFRHRMTTEAAQKKLKQRGSIAEFANAESRNRGLTQFRTRGLKRMLSEVLWQALVFNFHRILNLKLLPAVLNPPLATEPL